MGFPMNYDSYDMVDHPSSKYPWASPPNLSKFDKCGF
jgi:hypothetical protein